MMLRLQARLRRLPANVRGALWMLMAAAVWATNDVIVKAVGRTIDPVQIAFFRCFFGAVTVIPFLLASSGVLALRTRRFGGHVVRSVLGYLAMVFSWYSVVHLPLADATALAFSRPLFMVVLAVVFLHEVVRWRRWSATVIGFLGVLIMARPGLAEINLGLIAAIVGAFFVAAVNVLIKSLAGTERPVTILFYFGVLSSLMALGPALWVWRTPTSLEFAVLVFVGVAGALGQYLTIRAFRIAEATAIDPFDYVRLIYAALFGFLFFAELPDGFTVIGAAIIVGSTWYIARRGIAVQREARVATPVQSATTAPDSTPGERP